MAPGSFRAALFPLCTKACMLPVSKNSEEVATRAEGENSVASP